MVLINFFYNSFQKIGCKVYSYHIPGWNFYKKRLIPTRLLSIDFTRKRLEKYYRKKINNEILNIVKDIKPNIFFVQNESDLLPDTLYEVQKRGIITINLNGDYIFDSSRYTYFPISLKYFDYVFYGEKLWLENYQRIAPKTKFIKTVGAYDPDIFYPLEKDELIRYPELKAKISFSGSAYGFKAEGHYRVEILNSVADLGLKIWGGDRWDRYFEYYPKLKACYQGRHLDFQELNILYQNSIINLNITNPQCLTTFQQRTFEIAAAGAFQIADYKEEIYEYFDEDEIVTFKTQDELIDKCKYYLKNPDKRIPIINKQLERVKKSKHTYKDRTEEYLKIILEN